MRAGSHALDRREAAIEKSSDDAREIVVGVLAAPGLPADLADQLQHTLPEHLRAGVSDAVTWKVDTVHDPFEAMYPDYTRLMEKAREHVRNTVWDLVVCITDQPMQDESGPVVASLHTDECVAVVSLPALGGLRLTRRLRASVVKIIASLTAMADGRPETVALTSPGTRVLRAQQDGRQLDLARPGRWSRARLLAGMVRVNRPWRLFRGLSRALAGALAGITFGVVYSNIWALGASLNPPRLAGLTLAAVAAMVVWTIVGHQLWERPRPASAPDPHVRLRNASTVLTVTVGALAFFLSMFAIALAAVALAIPPEYLASTLGHPVDVPDYLVIALMATVLGTIAGAVGSGLEDDLAVREATYGHRERERRRWVEHETENGAMHTRRN